MSKRNPAVLGVWGPGGTRVIAAEARWREPLQWDRAAAAAGARRRVFCASLADVFEDRPDLDAPRARLFRLIDATPHLDWLLLTKRPENFPALLPRRADGGVAPNVWLGVSAENQRRAAERIPLLLAAPAAVRFVSAEPLLTPLDLTPYLAGSRRVDWVILGGESGGGARPFDLAWARSLVAQCRAAGVSCFVKQLGRAAVADGAGGRLALRLRHAQGGDQGEFPEDLRVREWPPAPP
jgi:protein gp37